MRDQPEQQAPPVQRLRVRYAKRGRLRFASHRDFSRVFERAIARAGVPMAYSSGFHPHPRISYAGAAPTGAASEAEYLEIGLAEVRSTAEVQAALDDSLPDGLDVLEVAESPGGALAPLLEASVWDVRLGPATGQEELAAAVEALLATTQVLVERVTKRGPRTFDARGAVVSLQALAGADGDPPRLRLVLRHTEPAVRAQDVLNALTEVSGTVLDRPLLTRLAQGPLADDGAVGDPLAT
ncbi:TIGR03936 family radical SAM-associated protein [Nocardioides sp. CFH 31398]|uniref:TIGR03936 family radical SAM-associated protein n=1 Tax=Nocardioides sp. CFH 31398 TaxID=2919579 RepID=UPI001F063DD8|nr:TIGR03936 family radical SAM-associated protein [Nocardioides sp. CFH 31398]MCH1867246.1 TIGR03936 family radical SAM-associated protein [Nocardioides sp. CFH 31398]